MIKYKLLEVLINALNVEIITPVFANKLEKMKLILNYTCNFERSKEKLILSYPSFDFKILSESKNNDEKDETNILNFEITYFTAIRLLNEEKVEQQEFEDYLTDEIQRIILPYFNSELNNILVKTGYPPVHNINLN
jgi:hypothetical protein